MVPMPTSEKATKTPITEVNSSGKEREIDNQNMKSLSRGRPPRGKVFKWVQFLDQRKPSAFSRNARSKFASVVLDSVKGPPPIARCTRRCACFSVVRVRDKGDAGRNGREKHFPTEGSLFALQANQWYFTYEASIIFDYILWIELNRIIRFRAEQCSSRLMLPGAEPPAAMKVAPATSSEHPRTSMITSSAGTKNSSQTMARATNM